jgi:hypothetical protein
MILAFLSVQSLGWSRATEQGVARATAPTLQVVGQEMRAPAGGCLSLQLILVNTSLFEDSVKGSLGQIFFVHGHYGNLAGIRIPVEVVAAFDALEFEAPLVQYSAKLFWAERGDIAHIRKLP